MRNTIVSYIKEQDKVYRESHVYNLKLLLEIAVAVMRSDDNELVNEFNRFYDNFERVEFISDRYLMDKLFSW